jgi:hypothetical protein
MKDAVATMGTLLPPDAGGRDAVHVAVIAVTAGQSILPGSHIGFRSPGDAGEDREVFYNRGEPIGIADPFIEHLIPAGARFWLYLYPRTITGLAHRWSHPAFDADSQATFFPSPAQRLASERWIRNWIEESGGIIPHYEVLMAEAEQAFEPGYSADALYLGEEASGDIPAEFWSHVEIIFGKRLQGTRPDHFRCSC